MKESKKARKNLFITTLSLTGLCLLLVDISALSNLGLPQRSAVLETLSKAGKISFAEMYHLRQVVDDQVWPGWGEADIPAIAYNESYANLVCHFAPHYKKVSSFRTPRAVFFGISA